MIGLEELVGVTWPRLSDKIPAGKTPPKKKYIYVWTPAPDFFYLLKKKGLYGKKKNKNKK